jgi:aryl sulfotransferase
MSTPTTIYRSLAHDSTRWQGFEFRQGDIVITTPPKCGTTWVQMICGLLIFQRPSLPRPLDEISPWLDMLTRKRDDVIGQLAAQTHRRFIKSHTPLDGLPLDDRVTYICVGRDPRDAAVSMDHHRSNFHFETFFAKRTEVAGREDLAEHLERDPPSTSPTQEGRFWQWVDSPVPAEHSTSSLVLTLRHFDEALRARERANVVVLHYADLKADLEGEMRRLARRLDIEVAEARWPTLVQAASFDAMRSRAAEIVPNAGEGLFKESERFFHSGTGGQWRAFFDQAAEQRYQARISALTSAEVAAWAHQGASALSTKTPRRE